MKSPVRNRYPASMLYSRLTECVGAFHDTERVDGLFSCVVRLGLMARKEIE
jgi:hypothetical protein